MEKSFRERYEQQAKKFKLPSFDDLEKEFNISEIENPKNMIRDIREKIGEKIHNCCELLDQMLQPDTNLSSLYESRVFSEEHKIEIFEMYKKLMRLKRKANFLYVQNDEKADAEFISDCLNEWVQVKPGLSGILKKMEESWKINIESAEKLGYLG